MPEPTEATLTSADFIVRDADPDDFEAILRLNSLWQHVTSPLSFADLERMHGWAEYHRVAETPSGIGAFLLALSAGTPYASPNYRWFDERFEDFLYIDRVVVSVDHQQAGLGRALYEDVAAYAQQCGHSRILCEIDVVPLNEPSDAFHRRMGFTEVGRQWVAEGAKQVSLRMRTLG